MAKQILAALTVATLMACGSSSTITATTTKPAEAPAPGTEAESRSEGEIGEETAPPPTPAQEKTKSENSTPPPEPPAPAAPARDKTSAETKPKPPEVPANRLASNLEEATEILFRDFMAEDPAVAISQLAGKKRIKYRYFVNSKRKKRGRLRTAKESEWQKFLAEDAPGNVLNELRIDHQRGYYKANAKKRELTYAPDGGYFSATFRFDKTRSGLRLSRLDLYEFTPM